MQDYKKIFRISLIIDGIGLICMLIPAIIMMCDFNHEPAGEHVILGILLGLGFGLLTASLVFLISVRS
jgi:hypothetical protein